MSLSLDQDRPSGSGSCNSFQGLNQYYASLWVASASSFTAARGEEMQERNEPVYLVRPLLICLTTGSSRLAVDLSPDDSPLSS